MSSNTGLTPAQSAEMKAYHDKISAKVQEAKARLGLAEAAARQKKAEAEIVAINSLRVAQQGIEAKIDNLKTAHEANVSRAKAEIDADVAKFKASIDELAAKLKTPAAKK